MRISDWSSDVCSSDLYPEKHVGASGRTGEGCAAEAGACRHPLKGRSGRGHLRAHAAAHHPWRRHVPGDLRLRLAGRLDADEEVRCRRGLVDPVLQGARLLRSEHRSEAHTSELQSLMSISYAVFCLKKKTK